jgi:cell division protein FtsB
MSDTASSLDTGLKVVEIASILGSMAVVFYKMGGVTSRVETLLAQSANEISSLKSSIQAMSEVVTKVAVQSTRLDNQADRIAATERHIEDLRHGDGFIVKRQIDRVNQ